MIAHAQVIDGHAHLDAVAQHGRILGSELGEGTQGRAGGVLCTGLEIAAEQDQDGHGRRNLEVDLGRRGLAMRKQLEGHLHAGLARAAQEERVQRPRVARDHPDRDQGVHAGRAMAKVDPGRAVEGERAPHHYRRCQGEGRPLPVGELQRGNHREQHDGHGQGSGHDQSLSQLGECRAGLLGGQALCGLGLRLRLPSLVARRLDRGDGISSAEPCRELDVRLLRRVVDSRRDARHLVELLLDAQRAGRARHSLDVEVDGRRRRRASRLRRGHTRPPRRGLRPPAHRSARRR